MEKTMDKIVAVAKSRGFVYPGAKAAASFSLAAKSTAAWQIPGITARSVLS